MNRVMEIWQAGGQRGGGSREGVSHRLVVGIGLCPSLAVPVGFVGLLGLLNL